MKSTQPRRGYAVVWVLIGVAIVTAWFASIKFVNSSPDPTMSLVFWTAIAVVAAGMLIEAKRDLYTACYFTVLFTFITMLGTGAVAIAGSEPHPVAARVAIGCGILMLVGTAYLIRTQYGREVLPNVLRHEFGDQAILEMGGVQFITRSIITTDRAMTGVQFVVQNCWDTQRTFVVGLRLSAGLFGAKPRVQFAAEASVVLPPAAVAALTVPFVPTDESGRRGYGVLCTPKVLEAGGTRVRRWRAAGVPSRIPTWLTVALAPFGIIAFGGGIKVQVNLAHAPVWTGNAPEVHTELVWQPEPHDLVAAVRAA